MDFVTVFHSHIHRHLQMATLHCAMAIDLKSNISKTQSLNSILQAWRGEKMHYTTLSHPLNRMGKAKGRIIGGNLSILYSLLGSSSDIETDGAILFIEDLDEYLYHIDRMMLNMKRNEKLSRLAALLVGGMTKMNDNETPYGKNAEEIIAEHCAEYNYPLIFRFPTGHIEENLALKLGCEHQLLCDENGGIIMG